MINFKTCITVILIVLVSGSVFAVDSFSRYIGARPVALGGAYVAMAEDASSVYVNPAALARIDSLKLLSFYTTPFPNTNVVLLSAVFPAPLGITAGVSYLNNTTYNIPLTVEANYTQQEFLFSFAGWSTENLTTGLTFNYLTKGFSVDNPDFASATGFGFNMDFGAHYKYNDNIAIGLALQNILPNFLGGQFYYNTNTYSELPGNIKVGTELKFAKPNNLTFLIDFNHRFQKDVPLLAQFGTEWNPIDSLAVRAGFDQIPDLDNNISTNLTMGVGFKYRGVTIDYAYYRQGSSSSVINYISLGYVGEVAKKPAVAAAAAAKPEVVPLSELLPPRVAMQQFKDISESFYGREAIEQMATAGLLTGFPDGTFRPSDNIKAGELEKILAAAKRLTPSAVSQPEKLVTRAEMVKALVEFDKILVEKKVEASSFTDVPKEHWAAPYVEAALQNGIIGITDKFYPDQLATRAELAQMLAGTSVGRAAIKRLH